MQKHALTLIAVAAIALAMTHSPFSTAQTPSDRSDQTSESNGAGWEYAVLPVGKLEDGKLGHQRLQHEVNRYAGKGFEPYMQSGDYLILRKPKNTSAPSNDDVPAPALDSDAVEVKQPKREPVEQPELE